MAKKDIRLIGRDQLLIALEHTYEDARFLVGVATETDADFGDGLTRHRSEFWSKGRVLQVVSESRTMAFCRVPGHENYIVLNSHLFLCRGSINQEQVFPTPTHTEGMIHRFRNGQPHYDLYLKIDHKEKDIPFVLGNARKTLTLIEHTEWAWKLTKTSLLCSTTEDLERSFLDDFWCDRVVRLGRSALGIKDII